MHEDWQELIPYYVAGTLPASDAAFLEQHLAMCDLCRTSLAEWRLIGEVVRAEAESWARQLPPLSPRVRNSLHQRPASPSPNGFSKHPSAAAHAPAGPYYPSVARQRRRNQPWLAATLIAAALTVVLFGGVMLYVISRNLSSQNQTTTPNGMAVNLWNSPNPTQAVGASVPATPTQTAQVTRTPTPIRAVPTRPPARSALPTASPQTRAAATSALWLTPPPDRCSVSSATGRPVNIYLWPGLEYSITGVLDPKEFLGTYIHSGTGWYEVYAPGGGIAGWVPAEQIRLNGPCTDLWLPSPTPLPLPLGTPTPLAECLLSLPTPGTLNLRSGPGMDFPVINAVGQGILLTGIARSDNGWFRVTLTISSTVWIGWVSEQSVQQMGRCGDLPVLQAGQYLRTLTPQPTPTLPDTPTPLPTATPAPSSTPTS